MINDMTEEEDWLNDGCMTEEWQCRRDTISIYSMCVTIEAEANA